MSHLRILSTHGRDREYWISLLGQMPEIMQDLHYHPDYMEIDRQTFGDEVLALLFDDGECKILQPFVKRKIPHTDYFDISSVYGYGGPISSTTPSLAQITAFQQALHNWAQQAHVVAEYCMLHPFFHEAQKALLPKHLLVSYRKDVVSVDLNLPLTALWAKIKDPQRKSFLNSRKKNVVTKMSDGSVEDYADFHRRYIQTMQHVKARDFWYFPQKYFTDCRSTLGKDNVSLFHAIHEDKIIASVFHIHLYDTVYYHLSCTNLKAQKLGPIPVLLFDSFLWAKASGFKKFHLGGGRTDSRDSLFAFKNSFCHNNFPLYAYKRIFNAQQYTTLTSETLLRETQKFGAPNETNFFPRYRA